MMKMVCPEKCGYIVHTGDNDEERINAIVAKHVAEEHGSVEDKHKKALRGALELGNLIMAQGGFKITTQSGDSAPEEKVIYSKFQARDLVKSIQDCLGIPWEEKEVTASPLRQTASTPMSLNLGGTKV